MEKNEKVTVEIKKPEKIKPQRNGGKKNRGGEERE